jgi:hypothetical protein
LTISFTSKSGAASIPSLDRTALTSSSFIALTLLINFAITVVFTKLIVASFFFFSSVPAAFNDFFKSGK